MRPKIALGTSCLLGSLSWIRMHDLQGDRCWWHCRSQNYTLLRRDACECHISRHSCSLHASSLGRFRDGVLSVHLHGALDDIRAGTYGNPRDATLSVPNDSARRSPRDEALTSPHDGDIRDDRRGRARAGPSHGRLAKRHASVGWGVPCGAYHSLSALPSSPSDDDNLRCLLSHQGKMVYEPCEVLRIAPHGDQCGDPSDDLRGDLRCDLLRQLPVALDGDVRDQSRELTHRGGMELQGGVDQRGGLVLRGENQRSA